MSDAELSPQNDPEDITEQNLAPVAAKLGRIAAVRSHVSTLRSRVGDRLDKLTGVQFPVTSDQLQEAKVLPPETTEPGAVELKREVAPPDPAQAGNPLFNDQPQEASPQPTHPEQE